MHVTDQADSAGRDIPFNKPYVAGKELHYVAQAITSGRIAGDGEYTLRCARLLEERFGIKRVLMTPSCTAALEMAAMLCGLEPGDEVLMPSFTFVSTASAVVRLGARPVFVDIRNDTLNLDESLLEAAITPRTRAIFPVHYAGVGCAMDSIMALAARYHLFVVEDAAQGVNSFYKGQALGSIGHLGTYSFHDTKNIVCGEGGALCCNTPEMVERAEVIRDKGTNRTQFFRGNVDKYTWIDVGSSYIPSEIACAFLLAQLESMDEIMQRRRSIAEYYRAGLTQLAREGLLRLPHVPENCEIHYRNFYVILNEAAARDGMLAYLRTQGVTATFHYVPLHCSPMGAKLGYRVGDLAATEDLSARLLRLPAFVEITRGEQDRVIELISAYFRSAAGCLHGREPGPQAAPSWEEAYS